LAISANTERPADILSCDAIKADGESANTTSAR
jgi:hypothetical protein